MLPGQGYEYQSEFVQKDPEQSGNTPVAWFRKADALVLAGDVSEDLVTLQKTLTILRSTFGSVFYVPGARTQPTTCRRSINTHAARTIIWQSLRKLRRLSCYAMPATQVY